MTTMPTFDSAGDLPSSEWRAALLAAIEIAEEALEHDAMGTDVARDLGADTEEMTEECDWIAEKRARLDKLRPLLVDPSISAPLSRDPGERIFDNGHVDTIRPQIPAVVFSRWAAHPSIDYAPAAALTVDGGADLASRRVGWVVTHVATGYTLPASLVDGLSQEQAEAIACALEEAGNCVCNLDSTELLQEESVIAQVVYETLDGLANPGASPKLSQQSSDEALIEDQPSHGEPG